MLGTGRSLALVAIALAGTAPGCIEFAAVDCGNGLICPAGYVCDTENDRCLDPRPQCGNFIVEPERGEVCDDGNLVSGDGCAATCTATEICGDGVLDMGEICDDGNNVATDDCSSNCRSTLACGNGIVDDVVGEMCDDGNRTGRDGCDAACQLEVARWLELAAPGPTGRTLASYDPQRARTVLYLDNGTDGAQTWERFGANWRRLPTSSPVALSALAYDREAGGIVAVTLGQAYRWSGTSWRLYPMASPRAFDDLVYHAAAKQLVGFTNVGRVYTLSAQASTLVGTIPFADGGGFGVAYDPSHGVLVRHGGVLTSMLNPPSAMSETSISADGVSWTRAAAPSAIANAALAWDSAGQQLVVAGGISGFAPTFVSLQTKHATFGSPFAWTNGGPVGSARWGGPMAHDSLRQTMILVGGSDAASAPNLTTEVRPSGGSWTQEPLASPPILESLVELPRGGVLLGSSAGAFWSYRREQGWRQEPALAMSGAPATTALFADRAHGLLVWAGRSETCTRPDDLASSAAWACAADGTTGPGQRIGAATAYDRTGGVAVLFGGNSLTDTYTWTQAGGWMRMTGVTAPGSCLLPSMVYEPSAQRFVLSCTTLTGTDTWTWNGMATSSWRVIGAPLSNGRLVYNPDLDRVVLLESSGATMVLTGDAWVLLPNERRRTIPLVDQAVYASADRELVAVSDNSTFVLTWESSTDESCELGIDNDGDGLSGCADPDCWGRCTPDCPPSAGTACTSSARCGDGVPSPLETCRNCPADVGACPVRCGDFVCSPGEICPGDCPP